jgi:hypothetical protein
MPSSNLGPLVYYEDPLYIVRGLPSWLPCVALFCLLLPICYLSFLALFYPIDYMSHMIYLLLPGDTMVSSARTALQRRRKVKALHVC